MSGLLIDLFGSRQINEAFYLITLAPLPVWISWLFFPHSRWTQWITSPFLFPFLLSVGYLFFAWKAFTIGAPGSPEVHYKSVRGFLKHPMIFLVLWAHVQMANLFVAAVIIHFGRRERMGVKLEVALCWLFAPLAVVLFTLRRIVHRLSHPAPKTTK